MSEACLKQKNKWKISKKQFDKICVGLMFLLTVANYSFLSGTLLNLNNFILALFMVYIFTTEYYCFPVILILFGNDSLGSFFFGKYPFLYLGFAMMTVIFIFKLYKNTKINYRLLLLLLMFVATELHLLIFNGPTTPRMVIHDLMYFLMVLFMINDFKNEKRSYEPILMACGFSVFVSAIQSAFFGGIPYHIERDYVRYGVKGAGAGDPNISGFYLLIGFFILMAYCSSVKWVFKAPMMACIAIAVYRTGSSTTLGILLLILVVYIFASKKIKKSFKFVLAIGIVAAGIAVLVGGIVFAEQLSGTSIGRFIKKITQFLQGDVYSATTGRTYLAKQYLEYFWGQNILKILFGGNPLKIPGMMFASDNMVSHNTYIDFLVRYGLVIAVAIVSVLAWKLISAAKSFNSKNDDKYLFIKLLIMLFIFTVNVNSSAIYIITFMLFFMLDRYNNQTKESELT